MYFRPVDAGFLNQFFHHADDYFLYILCGITFPLGAFFDSLDDFPILIEDCSKHLGSAHVETNIVGFSHGNLPFLE